MSNEDIRLDVKDQVVTGEEPRSTPTPLGAELPMQSLDEMREEVWVSVQAKHPGLTKEEFIEMSEAFGF